MQYWRKIVQALVQAVQRKITKTTKYQRLGNFIMYVANRDILLKTAQKYILQARRVLQFFNFRPRSLLRWKEATRTYGRAVKLKPKREYYALE